MADRHGPRRPREFTDENGDGLDDASLLPYEQWLNGTGEIVDENRDGVDDNTGRSVREMSRDLREGRAQTEAERRAAERRDEAEGYSAEDRTDDLDAGGAEYLNPDEEERRAYNDAYSELTGRPGGRRATDGGSGAGGGAGGAGGAGGGMGGGVTDFDRSMNNVPILGWLTGANARVGAANAATEAQRHEDWWTGLERYMPTPDDLAVEYATDPGVEADWDLDMAAEEEALQGLHDVWQGGGLTDADRARMQLGEMEVGRQMRAGREADLAALQARGMGGSGAELASLLGQQQAGADALFSRDAQIQTDAEDRAYRALSDYGQLGGEMRGARADYNRWNTDYDRERSRWNTQQENRTRESRSAARQQNYDNRERQVQGLTRTALAGADGAAAAANRQDDADEAGASAIGSLLEEIL